MTDPILHDLLREMAATIAQQAASLARVEALLTPPGCALTAALAQTFPGPFTAREAWEKSEEIAARDRSQGRTPEGLPKALAREGLTSSHAIGRWAKTAPGILSIGKQNGLVLWRVSEWVGPPKVLSARPPAGEDRRMPQTGHNTGDDP